MQTLRTVFTSGIAAAFVRWCLLLCLAVLCFSAHAGEPSSKHFTTADGLASNTVYCGFQDSRGYIWFGTAAGVSRFNGADFETFTTANGLGGNEVHHIVEDAKGRVWFMPKNGRNSYYYRGRFHYAGNTPLLDALEAENQSIDGIRGPYADLYLPGKSGQILLLDSLEQVTQVQIPDPSDIVFMEAAPRGGYYVASQQGLYLLESGRLNPVPAAWETLPDNAHAQTVPGKGLLVTRNNELHYLTDTALTPLPLPESQTPIEAIHFVDYHPNSGLWLGTQAGVWQLAGIKATNKGTHYLPEYSVSSMLIDHEGSNWFTTHNSGVVYFYSKEVLCFDERDGIVNGSIRRFATGPNGTLLLAMENGQVQQYTPGTGFGEPVDVLSNVPYAKNEPINDVAWGVENLFVLSDHWLVELRPGSAPVAVPIGGNALLRAPWDPDELLIGHANGISAVHADSIASATPEKLKTRTIAGVEALCAFQGNVMLGTRQGVFRMNRRWEAAAYLDTVPALSDRITDLESDAAGRLWLATHGRGVVLVEGNKVTQLGPKHGLPSAICHHIFPTPNDRCWVATAAGLARISPAKRDQWKISRFTMLQGLPTNQIKDVALSGPTVWLASDDGLARFTEGYLRPGTVPPIVHIESIKANGIPLDLGKILKVENEGGVKITFSGISFKSFGAVTFQYRIKKLDRDWITTTANEVEYRTLPDGHHAFEVRAANADEVWSHEPAVLSFEVLPPYWKTWWFRSMLVFIFIMLLILSFRFSISTAIEDEQHKTERQQQISELQMQALRAQMNPHFIFNSLNSVQHFIATKDEKAALRYLSRFARLIRMVLENSRYAEISLSRELNALKHYMELELLRVDNSFKHTITIDPAIEAETLAVPPMLIQPYVENAIWHGLMLRGEGGLVTIDIELISNQLQIIIEDNGIGRERSAELNRKKRKFHESIGMHATKERLDLIGLVHDGPASAVVTEDLYHDSGEAAGTRVILHLPLRQIAKPELD